MDTSVTGVISITAAFCGIVALLLYHLGRLRLYVEAAKFPGPRALPLLGNAHSFVGNTSDILNKLIELANSYPSPFRVWLGSRLFIGVYDAEQLKTILLSPKTVEKDDLYKFLRPWLGTGLLTAPATKWRKHRKLIMPAFNSRILESYVKLFAKQSEILTRQMRKELQAGEFNIFEYASLCTLDIICETAMGVTVKAQTEKNGRYGKSVKKAFEAACTRVFKIWLHPNFIFNLSQLGRDQSECLEYLHGVTNDVIQMKKSAYNKEARVEKQCADGPPGTRNSFLDLLMELSNDGTKLTDEELREEVETMMIAGNDTTASVNSFVMLMLANYPEVQERAFQELCEIYGDEVCSDTSIQDKDLNRMEYLERVIKETMRIFPVAPILGRHITEDLDLGEYVLPKGCSIILGLLKLHRSERYWPDPWKFDPDRFLPEEVAKRHPYCYLPFSAGPRNCIGLKYAMMAMKVLLATVLRRYVLKKDQILDLQDIEVQGDIILKPVKPIMIRISERSQRKY